jgi:hypothetical protein
MKSVKGSNESQSKASGLVKCTGASRYKRLSLVLSAFVAVNNREAQHHGISARLPD